MYLRISLIRNMYMLETCRKINFVISLYAVYPYYAYFSFFYEVVHKWIIFETTFIFYSTLVFKPFKSSPFYSLNSPLHVISLSGNSISYIVESRRPAGPTQTVSALSVEYFFVCSFQQRFYYCFTILFWLKRLILKTKSKSLYVTPALC